jgi:tetratricopeptide (TPR) repeat protein
MRLRYRRAFALGLIAVLLSLGSPGHVQAQVLIPGAGVAVGGPAQQIPSQIYFNAMPAYHNGQYRDTLALFVSESRSGIRNSSSQWIDAIAYYTMAGEGYYQLGQNKLALEQYDAALKLYVAYSDWMMRIQFPPSIAAAVNPVRATPWGQSKRGAAVGAFQDTYLIGQGQLDQSQVVQRGGVIQSAISFPVHVTEIVRCTTLAIRRRRDLMGPVCKTDPLTQNLVDVLSRRPGPPNPSSEAWINVQLGCALAAAGSLPQAKTALEQAILVDGQFDHPLTSTALVELGRLSLESGDYPAAARFCEEATYACANFLNTNSSFANSGVLEEAFRLGFLAHLLLNQKGPYPPLAPALNWAKSNGSRHLQTSLCLLIAENMAVAGNSNEASGLLNNARMAMSRTDLPASRLGAQFNYLSALLAYQTGNVSSGDQTLEAALKFQRGASLWNFQIGLADSRFTGGDVSDRIALELFENVLRDPAASDWSSDPLESLAMLSTGHELPLEHWFELSLKNEKDREVAVEIADRARRHRFYSTLPLGGRLLTLRWILEGPTELLGDEGVLQRQNLLAGYPKYAKLAEEAAAIRAKLAAKPVVDDTPQARREQGDLLASLASVSNAQEILLREIAVRREPADMVFPPMRTMRDVQSSLVDGQVVLAFFKTSRNLHAFLFSHDKFAIWQVRAPLNVQKQVSALLRDMGNVDANHEVPAADLTKDAWRTASAKVLSLLLERSNVDLTGNFQEIVIVPDGFLWYLPFEALTIGPPDKPRLLISQAKVRYAPTVGLAVPYRGAPKPRPNIGVALGKLHPQDDATIASEAFERFAPSITGSVALPRALTASSNVYRVLLDGLIVLDDVDTASGPYSWSPLKGERGKGGEPLGSWLSLPWGGPEQLILPGYHTAAETGLRKGQSNGEEVFLSVCGLMATGARTVLLSRWRTAGQTSFDLVREFAQELPNVPAAEAWQRSVEVVSDAPLAADREPRVKEEGAADALSKADHPFFWAGYLLVDSGQLPPGANPPGTSAGPSKAQPAGPRPGGAAMTSPAGNGSLGTGPAAGFQSTAPRQSPAPQPAAGPPTGLAPPADAAGAKSDDPTTAGAPDDAKAKTRGRTRAKAAPKKSAPRKSTAIKNAPAP